MELKLFISIYYTDSILSMKLLYLDVLWHALLTSYSNLRLIHASFVFS